MNQIAKERSISSEPAPLYSVGDYLSFVFVDFDNEEQVFGLIRSGANCIHPTEEPGRKAPDEVSPKQPAEEKQLTPKVVVPENEINSI